MGFLGFFGMSSLSFLWPKLTGGFGTKIRVGSYEEILARVGPEGGFQPLFVPDGRFYITYYDGTGDSPVYAAVNATDTRLLAIYRKCVHLGCSVPESRHQPANGSQKIPNFWGIRASNSGTNRRFEPAHR